MDLTLKDNIVCRLIVPKSPLHKTKLVLEFPVDYHPDNIMELVKVTQHAIANKLECMVSHAESLSGGQHGRA